MRHKAQINFGGAEKRAADVANCIDFEVMHFVFFWLEITSGDQLR